MLARSSGKNGREKGTKSVVDERSREQRRFMRGVDAGQ